MLPQVTLRILLFAVIIVNVQSIRYKPKFCAECDDEVWEEVPCEVIFSSTSTTTTAPVTTSSSTTTPLPPTTTSTPLISTASTSSTSSTNAPIPINPLYPIGSTVSPIIYGIPQNLSTNQIESSAGYKKCYCECKSGCREFCRKVVLNPDTSKQILQLSRTVEPQANGHVEIKHLQERNFVSSQGPYQPSGNTNINPYYQQQQKQAEQQQQQQAPNLAYVESKPVYNPAQAYNEPNPTKNYAHTNDGNSYGLSLEEFTKLLNSDQVIFNTLPKIPPINYPLSNQPAQANLPVQSAYPPQPSYATDPQIAINGANPVNFYANTIPGASKLSYPRNFPTIPSPAELPPSYPPQSPYAPGSSVDAQTAVSGNSGGSAAAAAMSPDNYKSSYCSNPSPGYSETAPNVGPSLPTPKPITSPCAIRYKDASSALNNLQNIDPAIDNYLRGILYSNPPGTRGYGYPL